MGKTPLKKDKEGIWGVFIREKPVKKRLFDQKRAIGKIGSSRKFV